MRYLRGNHKDGGGQLSKKMSLKQTCVCTNESKFNFLEGTARGQCGWSIKQRGERQEVSGGQQVCSAKLEVSLGFALSEMKSQWKDLSKGKTRSDLTF